MSEDMELQGIGAPVPDWLKGLIRAVRSEAMQPKDARVKSLWDLLRQRQLLRRSPWLKAVLRAYLDPGLSARPHPRTARRIVSGCGVGNSATEVSACAGSSPDGYRGPLAPAAVQAIRPVALKPVASVRPAAMQPVRPVQMQPAAMRAARK